MTRKHTRSVGDALTEIRVAINQLVDKRDAARDQFVATIRKAMNEPTGDKEETLHILADHGVNRPLAKKAVELAEGRGKRFTIWSVVDALTQLSRDSNMPRAAWKQTRGPQHCWPSQRSYVPILRHKPCATACRAS